MPGAGLELGADQLQGLPVGQGRGIGLQVGRVRDSLGDVQQSLQAVGPARGLMLLELAAKKIVDLVAGHDPQPAAERIAGPIFAELRQGGRNGEEHLLHHVAGVVGGDARAAAPTVDRGAVEFQQPLPGLGIAGLGPLEQAARRRSQRAGAGRETIHGPMRRDE